MTHRRDFLRRAGGGFGALALAGLLADDAAAFDPFKPPEDPSAVRPPHFPAKAQRVVSIFLDGAPSHIDLFDPKPELAKLHGEPLPDSFGPVPGAGGNGRGKLLASKRRFVKHGHSGLELCDWLPHLGTVADELAVVRSCVGDSLNHIDAALQMNTGAVRPGRPSLGAWALYGLGTPNRDLPGFVVMTDGNLPIGGPSHWGPGFMPASYQGTLFRNGPVPVANLAPPPNVPPSAEAAKRDLLRDLNSHHLRDRPGDSALAARINAYELAFRMQAAAPEAVDLAAEDEATKELYGVNQKDTSEFGKRCLLARRLLERGVRFVQIYCGGGGQWDAHRDLEANHGRLCRRLDKPAAALIADLKRRGLLDSTLVLIGGEFGRTPMSEGADGRDHNPFGFSTLFAGGGVKGGTVIGATDAIGLRAVEAKAHVHDLHATILRLMGLDPHRLTFVHNGRTERLTEADGQVLNGLIA